MSRTNTTVSAAALVALAWVPPADAADPVFTFSHPEPAGAVNSVGLGLNDNGQMVGSYTDATGHHGFAVSGGVVTVVDRGPNTDVDLNAINDGGVAVGGAHPRNGTDNALKYQSATGKATVVARNGGQNALNAINRRGMAVGTSSYITTRGMIVQGQTVELFDAPLASATVPLDVNNMGTTVGSFVDSARGKIRGFVKYANEVARPYDFLDGSTTILFVTLSGNFGGYASFFRDNRTITAGFYQDRRGAFPAYYPGAARTEFVGVNGSGHSQTWYGNWYDTLGQPHAFSYRSGNHFYSVNPLDYTISRIARVSSNGAIVVTYRDATGHDHAFVGTCSRPPCRQ